VGRGSRRSGLTLLEVLLSLALIVMMMAGVYAFYTTSLRARREGSLIARDILLDRAILEQMAEEIRHATDIVPGDGIGFRGEEHKITIVRTRMPELYAYQPYSDLNIEELPPAQMDLIRIGYELLWDEQLEDAEGVPICHGLWRTQQKMFDPNPQYVMVQDADTLKDQNNEEQVLAAPPIEGELFSPEIKYIRFQYYDGGAWRNQWQVTDDAGGLDTGKAAAAGKETYALPQAVMITIGRQREDPNAELSKSGYEEEKERETYYPDRVTIVVHLYQADSSLLTSRKYGLTDQLGRSEGVQ
jgi:hypothetical protein